jgi:hypothetical protein
MRNKLKELDVDFIGDGKTLTKEEELIISEFIRNLKEKQNKKLPKPKIDRKKPKEIA